MVLIVLMLRSNDLINVLNYLFSFPYFSFSYLIMTVSIVISFIGNADIQREETEGNLLSDDSLSKHPMAGAAPIQSQEPGASSRSLT